jgi:hypothetical protein
LEKRREQVLGRSEGDGGRRRTLYAHLNKCIDNLSPRTKGKENGNT